MTVILQIAVGILTWGVPAVAVIFYLVVMYKKLSSIERLLRRIVSNSGQKG
jgi:hypothetical protein